MTNKAALEAPSIFRESRLRVKRAAMHRNAFADPWNELIRPETLDITAECNADRTGTVRFQRRSPPSPDAFFELGEFFYQLRAALDCLVFTAIRQITGDPVPNEDSIYFPIADIPSRYERHAGNLGKLPSALREWIRSVQPCFALSSSDPMVNQIGPLLLLLHDCARKDRHRRLTVIGAFAGELSGAILFTPHVQLEHIEARSCDLLSDKGILAEFRVAQYHPCLRFEMEANIELDVVMESIRFSGPRFIEALDSTGRVVDYTIEQFEKAFAIP